MSSADHDLDIRYKAIYREVSTDSEKTIPFKASGMERAEGIADAIRPNGFVLEKVVDLEAD